MRNQNTIILKKFLDAETKRDLDAMAACLHDEFSLYVVGADELIEGKANFLNVLQKVFAELKDWDLGVGRIIGNETIAVEFNGTGHFSGEFEGKRYSDVPIKIQSISVFDFEDGLIKKCSEYYDSLAFKQQLLNAKLLQ